MYSVYNDIEHILFQYDHWTEKREDTNVEVKKNYFN